MIEIVKILKNAAVNTLNYGFLLFVITPLMILLWYCSWTLMDFVFLFEDIKIFSILTGFGGHFLLLYCYGELINVLSAKIKYLSLLITTIKALFSGLVSIAFWRIVWICYDLISLNEYSSLVLNILQNSTILMALKVFCNTLAVPFVAVYESTDLMPASITYFRTTVSSDLLLFE